MDRKRPRIYASGLVDGALGPDHHSATFNLSPICSMTDLAEDFARVDIFQSDVGIDRSLNVAVAEKSSDELVLPGAALEDESACCVPELMHGHPQPRRPINPLCDLAAQQGAAFGAPVLPQEQPVIFPAA